MTDTNMLVVDAAVKKVSGILDLNKNGGKIIRRDALTFILIDYDFISQHTIEAICTQLPSLEVYTHSTDSSSSGYMITFVHVYSASWIFSDIFIQQFFCLLCLIACVAYGLEYIVK